MHLCPGPGKAHECKEDLNWQQRILPMAGKDWTGIIVMSQPCNPGCFTSTRIGELGDLCYKSTSSKLPGILLGTQYILISKMLLERGELDCSCQISIYHLQLSPCSIQIPVTASQHHHNKNQYFTDSFCPIITGMQGTAAGMFLLLSRSSSFHWSM